MSSIWYEARRIVIDVVDFMVPAPPLAVIGLTPPVEFMEELCTHHDIERDQTTNDGERNECPGGVQMIWRASTSHDYPLFSLGFFLVW